MADLRARRLKARLTQSALAARSGVAQPNIAAYESGRRRPSAPTQQRLARALRPLPGEALRNNRDAVTQVLANHRMTNPRVFGSAAVAGDTSASDLDLLVDAAADLDLLDIIDAAAELEDLLQVPVDIVTSRSLRVDHEIMTSAVAI